MSHVPFRLSVPNLGSEMSNSGSNPKKRRKNVPSIQASNNMQDLLPPPPMSGYGDTIVASNPFDDCPSTVNINMRNPNGPGGMGMAGPGPNMGMNNMNMCRPMGMGMGSPMMHSPNAHQNSHMMNNPMMMNGPRMNHMGGGPPPGHGPHMMASPNGAPPGPMHPIAGPIHSPLGGMGPMSGPGNGVPMGSPMGVNNPMNGVMNSPMNGPPMGGHPQHPGPPGPGNMNIATSNGNMGGGPPPSMNNNNFIMSPMNNMYSKPMPVSAAKVYPADQPMVFNSQNPNAPPIYPCGICHKEVHDNDQGILCESGCNFWFHRGCTGLTETAFQMLTAEVYAEWVCDKCLTSKNIPLVKYKP